MISDCCITLFIIIIRIMEYRRNFNNRANLYGLFHTEICCASNRSTMNLLTSMCGQIFTYQISFDAYQPSVNWKSCRYRTCSETILLLINIKIIERNMYWKMFHTGIILYFIDAIWIGKPKIELLTIFWKLLYLTDFFEIKKNSS